jgi:hypothetical protein
MDHGDNLMTTDTALIKFAIGDTLGTRSACDYDCIFRFTVVSRSAKFVTLQYYNDIKRVGIKVRDGREYCSPLGCHSMSPILYADDNI